MLRTPVYITLTVIRFTTVGKFVFWGQIMHFFMTYENIIFIINGLCDRMQSDIDCVKNIPEALVTLQYYEFSMQLKQIFIIIL